MGPGGAGRLHRAQPASRGPARAPAPPAATLPRPRWRARRTLGQPAWPRERERGWRALARLGLQPRRVAGAPPHLRLRGAPCGTERRFCRAAALRGWAPGAGRRVYPPWRLCGERRGRGRGRPAGSAAPGRQERGHRGDAPPRLPPLPRPRSGGGIHAPERAAPHGGGAPGSPRYPDGVSALHRGHFQRHGRARCGRRHTVWRDNGHLARRARERSAARGLLVARARRGGVAGRESSRQRRQSGRPLAPTIARSCGVCHWRCRRAR
mmetsp:Transcript_4376/g.12809  ORF Transcript_4376/g.12809 Transcript_4376/m.12809 type:complete len:266 (+) Transcript_4376:1248-2045(+)